MGLRAEGWEGTPSHLSMLQGATAERSRPDMFVDAIEGADEVEALDIEGIQPRMGSPRRRTPRRPTPRSRSRSRSKSKSSDEPPWPTPDRLEEKAFLGKGS